MEAAAIGATKSALNSVVKTTTTAITDEIGLLLGVQKELFFIKEELEMMQGLLQVAKTEKVKGVVVSIWVRQVQELAYDVEDFLQEASVYLMKKSCLPVMCSVKKRDHIARKIRVLKTRIEDVSNRNQRYNLINKDNGGHAYDESISTRSIANVQALLVGLEEPKRNLVNLILMEDGEVISVVGMGGLGKTTLAKEVYGCKEVRDEFKCFAWVTVQHPFNTEEFIETLAKQILSNAQEVDTERRTVDGNKIKTELLSKKNIKEMVTEFLKDKRYLIVLDDLSSMSEWNKMREVLPTVNGSRFIVTTRSRPLAESISNSSDNIYEIKELSENDAFNLFCKAVYKTTNYRLLIDQSQTKDGPPEESHGSMNGPSSNEIIEEDSEAQKHCITITITEDMKNEDTITITEDMKNEAGLIIKSCGRLPLAIVTIGSYLATKPKTSVEWKTRRGHLSSELGNNPNLGIVNTVLTSSYDGLPYHLKPSSLYLSVFPNHKEIRRSRIIRRWMADGYVMESRKKTAEEVGKGYFYDLMGRSLIQPSQMSTIINGDVKRCNIHDMMYELILAKAEDENMVSVLEDENLITMTDKVRHLVIAGGPCTGDKVLERVKLSHMRSLSIFGEVGDYLRYPRMKLVRVLDLEGTLNLNNQDLRSVGKLRHLKYLGLRGTKITKLPDSLGKLSELETLDIRNTNVNRLPTGFTKLHKLSYLRAGSKSYIYHPLPIEDYVDHIHDIFDNWEEKVGDKCSPTIQGKALAVLSGVRILCGLCCFVPVLSLICLQWYEESKINHFSSGVRVPRGIGKLRSLNVFGVIDIGGSKSLAKEIQNLTNLRKLAVTNFTEENGKTLAKVIDGLKHLRSLDLKDADNLGLKCCLESVSSPPKYLQSLKLDGRIGKLPDWISSLENLEKIHFKRTYLTEDIKAIEKLPNVKILYLLRDSFKEDVKELCFGEGTFPMLQVMILEELITLESVSIKKTALKRLEQLKIRRFWEMREDGVSGLDFLEQLKEMEVVQVLSFHMWKKSADDNARDQQRNNTFVSKLQEKLSMHPTKPVLRVIKEENVWY
ncbi:Disease resistance protein RPM1 [Carex littledalei]|uniref:Disease resistance protein RPM1 n=1 Tax=Carex littledalei TaxID=544730 RepID=A0A833R821_9POAL|nr:Disease resistance protein RPM1 [Carex littledalei]